MILADWIMLILIVGSAGLGLLLGFGRTLKFFTGGIVGIIISIVVCYFMYGVVVSWGFVQDIMLGFVANLKGAGNPFCDFLLVIHIEIIILCIIMFVAVQIIRIIIVNVIRNIVEIKTPVIRMLNKLFGMLFFTAVTFMLVLVVMQVVAWIGSGTEDSFMQALEGSAFRLDLLYLNNPLRQMYEMFTR